MKQATIFITGATGSVGSSLIQNLSAANIPLKALVRPASTATALRAMPNVEIIEGDLADASSYEAALAGIERAFLLTNSSEQAETLQTGFVQTAQRAGVKHIVKLSQLAADEASPVRFLRYHARVERVIRESGITYTFLRPNLYMQGLLAFAEYIQNDGHFFASVGNARVSAVDVRDIAAVAAACLTEDGHEQKTYDITGPKALTHYEMAEIISMQLKKPVQFIDVTPEQMEGGLRAAGFPEWQVGGLIEDYAHYARGEAAAVSNAIKQVIGRPPIAFGQFAADYESVFE